MHKLRQQAERLRAQGYSYNLINQKLGVSKGTMSYWFKDKPFTPNKTVLRRIKNGPASTGIRSHNKRVESIQKLNQQGVKEIGKLSKRDLWLLGLGIYIGEGSKSAESVRVINSDPAVIITSIRWFKEVCNLTNENIVISIHLYPDNDIDEAISFWQKMTELPLENFRKTQIDQRQNKRSSKRGKLPYGTAHLRVVTNGNKDNGVVLYRRICGWMQGALTQL